MLAGIVGTALLLGAAAVTPASSTDAAFTDPEQAGSAFTALTVTPLTDASCQILSSGLGLTFTGVRLSWRSVYDMSTIADPAYSPVSGTNSAGTTAYLDRGYIVQSGPSGGRYTYTATMDQGLLGGLLGTVFGSTSTLTIQERYPLEGSRWVTPPKSFRLTVALAGLLGSSCTAI